MRINYLYRWTLNCSIAVLFAGLPSMADDTSEPRENLPSNATWEDVIGEYDANGYPDWLGERPEGANGFLTMAGTPGLLAGVEALGGNGTMDPTLVPAPWCLDLYGCVNVNFSWEHQREQNRQNWAMFGSEVPRAYGHTGYGEDARMYIVFGNEITVIRPDGTEGEVGELYNTLPDCPDDWEYTVDVLVALGGVSAGAAAVFPPIAPEALALSGLLVGGASLYWLYCYHAEGV